MRTRLPLFVKILFWFFLNMALLAAVSIALFNAQFRFDLDWFLGGSARGRIDTMRNLITTELNNTVPEAWERVIERFGEAYHVRLSLFDDDGNLLIGPGDKLPGEVQEKILPPPRTDMPPGEPDSSQSDMHRPHRPRFFRNFVRTTNPTRYWLLTTARLDNPQAGEPMHVVLVAEDTSLSMGGLIIDLTPWIWLGAGSVIFSVLFWLPLLRGITRSIGQMTDATREIAEGRFDARVPGRRRDELGALAEAINRMAARLDGLVKGQKRFLGDVAHELCAPLSRLQMALGIIEQRSDEKQKTYAKSASEKAGQIASLVNELLAFSRASFGASAVHLQPVAVQEAVDESLKRETTDNAEIKLDIPADLKVSADPELLIRALANLIRNAIRYGANAGSIQISAAKENDAVKIRLADQGPGVPDTELAKIFDAFHRLDDSRTRETGGVGLGLSIVKTCIDSCGGSVSAVNRQPHGLEVIIQLPVA
jgi:two-component system, OmpR family, sensor histidine kinase CpxA